MVLIDVGMIKIKGEMNIEIKKNAIKKSFISFDVKSVLLFGGKNIYS